MLIPPRLPPRRRRAAPAGCALLLAVWVACAGATGCLRASGAAPLDLSVAQGHISDDRARLVQIRQVMERDLAQLKTSRQDFEAAPRHIYRAPFPLDLFKYVAVDCFNEPYVVRPGAPSPASAEQWSCAPQYLGRLLAEIEQKTPEHKAAAMQRLHQLDRLRQMRARLLFRLGQLPGVLGEMRQLLATRRADLRRMRAAEARRRTEYQGSDWQEMERRFERFEQEIAGLSQEVERLAEEVPTWKPRVEAQISALYAHLTTLSASSDPAPARAQPEGAPSAKRADRRAARPQ